MKREDSDKLWKWNKRMACIHAILATMIAVVAVPGLYEGHHGAPYMLRFERMWKKIDISEIPDIIKQPYCPGGVRQTDVWKWFKCIREHLVTTEGSDEIWNDDTRARLYKIEPSVVVSIKVWALLFIFEGITSFFHFCLATRWRNNYEFFLNLNMQPFRWIEYSMTSSIMLLAIFSLSRITEIYALVGMFLCSVFLCLCGGLLFELFEYLQKVVMEPLLLNLFWKLKWTFFILAWVSFTLHYACLFDAFYTAIDPYFSLPSEDLWRQLFGFIQILNFSILLAYLSFPILHIFQISNKIDYVKAEIGYMWLSLISKSILTIIIFVATVQRDDS